MSPAGAPDPDPRGDAPEGPDRETGEGAEPAPQATKLLQGYVWHPRDLDVDLADHLPATLGEGVHVLLDAISAAPFAFFDDGTLSASQQFYQLTVLAFVEDPSDAAGMVPWIAETLQQRLESTPDGVGWQVFEDLREVG